MIKKLWEAFIVRVFPGTLEEYYAAREIHFREQRKYRRTGQHIVGAILVIGPTFLLFLLGYLPLVPWGVFVVLMSFGHVLVSDAATEHLCLLLLRQQREAREKSGMEPAGAERANEVGYRK